MKRNTRLDENSEAQKLKVADKKVLVVEPHSDFSVLIRYHLKKNFNVIVQVVNDSERAIELLRTEDFDLIVHNYDQHKNGIINVLTFLTYLKIATPVVVFGNDNPYLPVGYENFVKKPYLQELVAKIEDMRVLNTK